MLGLSFDKSPHNYFYNCDTITGTFDSPGNCQWGDCIHPTRCNKQKTGSFCSLKWNKKNFKNEQ